MKPKKMSTSKIILFIPYLFLIVAFAEMLRIVEFMITKDNWNYAIIQYYGLEVLIPIIGLCMVAQTTYSIKAKAENLANTMIYNIYSLIDIQKTYPEYQIYDSTAIKKDAAAIVNPYKEQMEQMNRSVLNETPTNK